MDQGAADGAAMAHLGVADLAGSVGQQRDLPGEQIAGVDGVVPGERADGDLVAVLADEGEVGEAGDVDEHGRRGQAQLHQG